MKKFIYSAIFAAAAFFAPSAKAEVSVSAGADLVSSYVWRGVYQTGAAVQPTATVSAGNFSIGAWGSTPLDSAGSKEVDFSAAYATGGLTLMVTDYWWSGQGSDYFKDHYLEATIGYTFQGDFPLSLAVSTMLMGKGDEKADGDQYYSTYITASYPFAVGSVDCSATVGISPFESGMYQTDGFDVCQITGRASKTILETDDFSLPVFVEATIAPATDDAFLIAGFGLRF